MSAFWDSLVQDQVLVKLLVALGLGGLIGLERELKGRAAGLRTHVLVCMGATILIIAGRQAGHLFVEAPGRDQLVMDPNRLAAGIMTGIGFLGAGAILRIGDLVRGLTTGACVWFAAAVGIVVGNGLYPLAVASTVLVLIVLLALGVFERRIPEIVYRGLVVSVPVGERAAFESWARAFLAARKIRIQETLTHVNAERGIAEFTFRIRARRSQTQDLIAAFSQRPEVRDVEVEAI